MDRLRTLFEARQDSAPQMISCPGIAFRPPPLRTTSTYDDDDTFHKVSLNLLSRHSSYGSLVAETIKHVLIRPEDRMSFMESLQNRKGPSANFSPSTPSLVEQIEKTFGNELRKIIKQERVTLKRQVSDGLPPKTPSNTSASGAGTMSSRNAAESEPKRRKSRRFFADCDSVLFRSRKVKNIDFRLVEAISEVRALRLDGASQLPQGTKSTGSYEPPPM